MMSVFMHSSFELEFGTFEKFESAMRRFIPALSAQGWRLIGAFRNTTGNISLATHLWELPDHDSLTDAPARAIAADPTLLQDAGEAAAILRQERITFLTPLKRSPPSGQDVHPLTAGTVFQQVCFDLQYGSIEGFQEAMEHVIPALSGQGWQLVGCFRNATGDIFDAMNLWQLPDLDSTRTAGPRARAANPGLPAEVAKLIKIIQSETVDLLAPLAHHPSTSQQP